MYLVCFVAGLSLSLLWIDKETRKNPGRPSLKIQRRRVRERLLMYHEYQIRIKMESFAFVRFRLFK